MPADNFDAVIASTGAACSPRFRVTSGNHPNEFSELKFIRRLAAEQSRSPTGRCPLCGACVALVNEILASEMGKAS